MLHYYHETYDFKCTNITKFKNHIKRYNSSCVAPSEPGSSIHYSTVQCVRVCKFYCIYSCVVADPVLFCWNRTKMTGSGSDSVSTDMNVKIAFAILTHENAKNLTKTVTFTVVFMFVYICYVCQK